MRWMLVGIALCGAASAYAFEYQPETSSFAYSAGHSYAGMPFEYVTVVQWTPPKLGVPQSSVAAEPVDPAVPPTFSKNELCSTAVDAAAANKLPARFFANLIQQESGFKPHVVSSAGAKGIAQFMPAVAAEQGLDNPFDPIQSLKASARLIANLVGQFGNVGLAAAAYNAGPRRVSDWLARRGRLPAETRNYVRSITGRPAERWVRVAAKVDEARLPPHAKCPGLPVIVARAPMKMKVAAVHPVRTRLAGVTPRLLLVKTKLAGIRHAAPAQHRVRLAAIR
jgi:hypothetical protein